MRNSNTSHVDGPITFRELILHLAREIGRHQIPVHAQAHDIHEFVGSDSVHHELVRDAVRAVYKANRCGHLDAPVYATQTFNALGIIRRRLSQSESTDIDQINLVDNIGWIVRKLLEQDPSAKVYEPVFSRPLTTEPVKILPLRRARY